jgi:hypothetical protein
VRTGEEDASGEKVETMVGFVANVVEFRSADSGLMGTCSSSSSLGCMSGSYPSGRDQVDHGWPPSPRRNCDGGAGRGFRLISVTGGRQSEFLICSWATFTSQGFSPMGGGADRPRS